MVWELAKRLYIGVTQWWMPGWRLFVDFLKVWRIFSGKTIRRQEILWNLGIFSWLCSWKAWNPGSVLESCGNCFLNKTSSSFMGFYWHKKEPRVFMEWFNCIPSLKLTANAPENPWLDHGSNACQDGSLHDSWLWTAPKNVQFAVAHPIWGQKVKRDVGKAQSKQISSHLI